MILVYPIAASITAYQLLVGAGYQAGGPLLVFPLAPYAGYLAAGGILLYKTKAVSAAALFPAGAATLLVVWLTLNQEYLALRDLPNLNLMTLFMSPLLSLVLAVCCLLLMLGASFLERITTKAWARHVENKRAEEKHV
ncbi:hypothetical protein [Alkalilimnicola ehrlichii]|nr:hypothetical protein [Alkalilimnicola ehrlichii]